MTNLETAMKKAYTKPTLVDRGAVASVTALNPNGAMIISPTVKAEA
jgi:hypothetical protein